MVRELPDAVFHTDGSLLIPTELVRGPWHMDSQHGSVMAGVLARALESAPSAVPMQVVRFTIDLIRAAPYAPVEVQLEVRHAGKATELVEARLVARGEVYARAHAVRYRTADLPVGDAFEPKDPPPPLDPDARIPLPPSKVIAFHEALHISPSRGFETPTMWIRMLRPLVAGEELTPLVRLAVALDWVYATDSLRMAMRDRETNARRTVSSINTDNHAVITRPAEGEWIGIDATVAYGPIGAGAASARFFDTRGLIGFGTQTLLLRGRDKLPNALGRA